MLAAMNKARLVKLAAAAASVAVLAVGAAFVWKTWGGGRAPEQAWITAAIQRGDLEDLVSATGSLQPRDYVDVGAQVSGQLRKLHVDVGSEVKEGDLLAEIDAETSVAKVDASKAQLQSQQAQLAERELALAKAERDLQRQKNLMAEDATTEESVQNAETAVKTARAQISSLKAQMAQLRASTRVDEANLKFTKIYAPMSGTVVSITARQGQTLNANQTAPTVLRIADLSTMLVQTQVSEADVSKLRTDMPVYFTTLGGQGRRWSGALKKIEPTPTVTNNVVLYNALFEIPNPGRTLMTQMTVQVFFIVAEAQGVLMAPMSAVALVRSPPAKREAAPAAEPAPAADSTKVVPEGEAQRTSTAAGERPRRMREGRPAGGKPAPGAARRATVRVMAKDGSIQEREVTIGVTNRVHAEVRSGLEEGEQVIAGVRQPVGPRVAASQPGGLGQQPLNPKGGAQAPGAGPMPGGAPRAR